MIDSADRDYDAVFRLDLIKFIVLLLNASVSTLKVIRLCFLY